MNTTTKVILSSIVGATLIVGATTTVYRSISISDAAKVRVVQQAATWKMTQRDTASKMILDYFEEPKVTEPYFILQPHLPEGCSYVPNVQRYIYTSELGNKWYIASTTCPVQEFFNNN